MNQFLLRQLGALIPPLLNLEIDQAKFGEARQCNLLQMERSSFYYTAVPEPDDGVRAAVVTIAGEFPSYGYRMIRGELRRRGFDVNAKRVRRLMREENLVIQVRRFVATSEYCSNHGDWPNLVKSRRMATLNEVWAADITLIDLGREFVYLAVIIDLHSPRDALPTIRAESDRKLERDRERRRLTRQAAPN
ncbi:MAG: IS3 family transposase [Gemmataceae bacterium]